MGLFKLFILGCVLVGVSNHLYAFVNKGTPKFSGLTNVALRKPAKQSSTYGTYSAHLAVDGDSKTFAHTHLYKTYGSAQQLDTIMSWEVDFMGQFRIFHVVLVPRQDCCFERFRAIEILFYDYNGKQVGFVAMGNQIHHGTFTHSFERGIVACRAVVRKDSRVANDHLHFIEFEAYGRNYNIHS